MSKQQEAFKLFNQGHTVSSPELKALGLKYRTRQRYLLSWRKVKDIELCRGSVIRLAENETAISIPPRKVCIRIFSRLNPARPLASVITSCTTEYKLVLNDPDNFYFDAKII